MDLEELKYRLWQCKFSGDRAAFDSWVKENIHDLLKRCIELTEEKDESEKLEREISNLEDEVLSLENEVSRLENTIDKLENRISSLVDNCDPDGAA